MRPDEPISGVGRPTPVGAWLDDESWSGWFPAIVTDGGNLMMNPAVSRLRSEVVEPLKRRFVGRDEVVNLIALAVTAGEHLFLHGPPGTAKSALIRQFAVAVRGSYFEYLLTRFSEPNEVFGPIDLVRLREGTVATVTTGMLPEGEFIFLDELFNANSAILNNLLTVLNERIYRRGAEIHQLPLLSLFAASNHLPEDEALHALFDRFLLRCHVENLRREEMPRLLSAGWELERAAPLESSVSAADLRALAGERVSGRAGRDRRAIRRGRLQGARPGGGPDRPTGRQGAEAGGRLGRALRPVRGAGLGLLGAPLCLGPGGTGGAAGLAGRRRDRAACRPARCPPPGHGPRSRRRRGAGPPARGGRRRGPVPFAEPGGRGPRSASSSPSCPIASPGSPTTRPANTWPTASPTC